MKESYTASNIFPFKMVKNESLFNHLQNGKIIPIHAQINPTNKCNLHCSFCSCENRNRNKELSFDQMQSLVINLSILGCKAVTITGGGEPLLYPYINELINDLNVYDIKVGLVTNGTQFDKLDYLTFTKITWCRISASDERGMSDLKMIKEHQEIDWAFSYVLCKGLNIDNLIEHINFANENNFTHIRVVPDLTNLKKTPDLNVLKNALKNKNINIDKVIFQDRSIVSRGTKNCYISLLKPNIGPDGKIYPCCGTQYALKEASLDYAKEMCMGDIEDLPEIYKNQKHFDGSICHKCYYNQYNEALSFMLNEMQHEEFV